MAPGEEKRVAQRLYGLEVSAGCVLRNSLINAVVEGNTTPSVTWRNAMKRNRNLQVPKLVGKELRGRHVLIAIQKLLGTKQHLWKNACFVTAVRKLMRRLRVFQRHVDALLPKAEATESTVRMTTASCASVRSR